MSDELVIEDWDSMILDNPFFPPNGMRFIEVAIKGLGYAPASDRPRITWYKGPGDQRYRPLKDGEEPPPNPFNTEKP